MAHHRNDVEPDISLTLVSFLARGCSFLWLFLLNYSNSFKPLVPKQTAPGNHRPSNNACQFSGRTQKPLQHHTTLSPIVGRSTHPRSLRLGQVWRNKNLKDPNSVIISLLHISTSSWSVRLLGNEGRFDSSHFLRFLWIQGPYCQNGPSTLPNGPMNERSPCYTTAVFEAASNTRTWPPTRCSPATRFAVEAAQQRSHPDCRRRGSSSQTSGRAGRVKQC